MYLIVVNRYSFNSPQGYYSCSCCFMVLLLLFLLYGVVVVIVVVVIYGVVLVVYVAFVVLIIVAVHILWPKNLHPRLLKVTLDLELAYWVVGGLQSYFDVQSNYILGCVVAELDL